MNRRRFVTLAGAMAMISSCENNLPTIVIGAGLAGLGAAHYLHHRLRSPGIILEARDRLGGRAWTSNLWDVPLDMGASWIHGIGGNPLTALAREAGVKLLPTYTDRYRVYPPRPDWDNWHDRVLETLDNKPTTDRSVQQHLEEQLGWQNLSAGSRKIVQSIAQSTIENEYAGNAGELSALYYDYHEAYGGGDALLSGGYQQIVNFLARDLDVRLNHRVSKIDWSGAVVKVTTNQGLFQAKKVIITLPLGVLKSNTIAFTPALPPHKQNAIDRLGMGILNKCYLRFPKIFWDTDIDWLQQPAPGWTEWVSFARVLGEPILMAFNGGDRGRELEKLQDSAIVTRALANLRMMLGQTIPDPLSFQLTRWGQDPYTLGSYSFHKVGYTPQLRLDLQAPLDNKLFFAGEATSSDYFGTAHGALESGILAAAQVGSLHPF